MDQGKRFFPKNPSQVRVNCILAIALVMGCREKRIWGWGREYYMKLIMGCLGDRSEEGEQRNQGGLGLTRKKQGEEDKKEQSHPCRLLISMLV